MALAIELVGVLAWITNALGHVMLTHRHPRSWWMKLASIVLWGVYAAFITSVPMLLNAGPFFLLNCYGIYKWRRMGAGQGESR